MLDHAAGLGPAVDEIADQDDRRVPPAIALDQGERAAQPLQLAVHVANGVEPVRHAAPPDQRSNESGRTERNMPVHSSAAMACGGTGSST